MTLTRRVLVGEAMLGFVFGKLEVRYRASTKAQRLTIDASYDEAESREGRMDGLVEGVQRAGLGGGAEFRPGAGRAKPLKGTFGYTLKQPLSRKKKLHAELQVTAVSPLWLRHVVEHLRVGCLEMRIVGELPVDGTPLSCTEVDIQRWVPSAEAWANRGLWEPLEYEVEEGTLARGASLRIHFDGPLDPKTCEKKAGLDWRMTALGGEVGGLLSADGTRAGSASFMPRLSRGTADLTAKWDHVDVARAPARALILNCVTHIHQTVQPVKKVILKM